jgi:hypothetical protein
MVLFFLSMNFVKFMIFLVRETSLISELFSFLLSGCVEIGWELLQGIALHAYRFQEITKCKMLSFV